MNDTERLDLLVKVLQKYELYQCGYGYTFFPKFLAKVEAKPLIEAFFPAVRDLLDAVVTFNLEEYE